MYKFHKSSNSVPHGQPMISIMKEQKPKAIIFDLFGVLCDSFNARWEKENLTEGTEQYDKFVEISKEIDLGKKSQTDYYVLASATIDRSPKEIKQNTESRFNLNEQLFGIIQNLRKEYKIALGSNSGAVFVRDLLKRVGHPLEDLFDYIFISSEMSLLKPDPEFFISCAHMMGLEPKDCVFIDDSMTNVRGAQSIGMTGHTYVDIQSFITWFTDQGF